MRIKNKKQSNEEKLALISCKNLETLCDPYNGLVRLKINPRNLCLQMYVKRICVTNSCFIFLTLNNYFASIITKVKLHNLFFEYCFKFAKRKL